MDQYKATLRYILDNGVMRSDRTGVGRFGVFSPPDETYVLSEGFPLTTLREIKPDAMIDELLWFISGDTKTSSLKYKFFWNKWTVKPEHARQYCIDNNIPYTANISITATDSTTPSEVYEFPEDIKQRIGTIGNLYGVSWRQAPGPKGINLPKRKAAEIPVKLLEQHMLIGPDDKPVMTVQEAIKFIDGSSDTYTDEDKALKKSLSDMLNSIYWQNYDQLNELILKIKTTPNSSRLRVTAYITDYMAFEEFSPQQNVMDGRAALTACHTFFQCFVNPPKQEGQKPKLDLKLTLTSSDAPIGRVYNIAQYALLVSMIAHVCDMDAGRLIVSTGDAHIYSNQFEFVDELLSRESLPLPKLWLNPEVKDLFAFTADDIKILDYHPHPAIESPPIAV